MRTSDRSQLGVTVAVLLAGLALLPLTQDVGYLSAGWLQVLAVSALSLGLRRLHLASGLVLVAQLMVWAALMLYLAASLPGPGTSWSTHVGGLIVDGVRHMQTQAAPMTPNAGVRLMFAGAVGLILIGTDLVVIALRRPAWSLVPLAALYLVPAISLPIGIGVAPFLATACGYLGVLVAEGLNRNANWTRGLSRDSAGGTPNATTVSWRAASYIGIPALVLALILAPLIPTLSLSGFGFGSGGNGPVQLADPTLDLKRNLHQPADREIISYQTSDHSGQYLRMASLPLLSKNGWGNAQFALLDQLPGIPGVATEPGPRITTTVRVGDFEAQYLPLPYAPRSFTAAGRWGVDAASLVVVSRNSSTSLRQLTYTVQSVDTTPSANDLAQATAGSPQDAATTAVIPADLPPKVVELTRSIIRNQTTDAGKAAAIQAYLRSDRFSYDTNQRPGTGYQALYNFLLIDHKGYCEQFAGSMAVMARIAGIPSRVAVGFLPGTRRGDTWHVSVHDTHAWPELYFAGYGWVRYEPTPSVASPPSWTLPTRADTSGNDPSTSASSVPGRGQPSAAVSSRPDATDPAVASPTAPHTTWLTTLGWSLGGLAVLVVLALPATVRVRRRSVRLADDPPGAVRVEGAWAEVRDTVVDLGGRWPEGSPRQIGAQVAGRLEQGPSADLGTLATLVERSRYARELPDSEVPADLARSTTQIRRNLAENRTTGQRLLAVVAPRSLMRALRLRRRRHR